MPIEFAATPGPLTLDAPARAVLEERIGRALTLARRDGARAAASVTVPVPADGDVSAAVLAARRADDRFFCLEQPDREGLALAALGAAAVVEARGDERFATAARASRE